MPEPHDAHRAHLAAGGGLRGAERGQRVPHHLAGARRRVRVEAAARLAAGQPGLAELLEDRRRGVQPVVGVRVHGLQDRTGGVHADQVEQRQRAHRKAAAEPHGRVDVLAGGVLRLVHGGGLVQVAEEQPVRDETGPVADRHRFLAEVMGQSGDGVDGPRVGQHRGDHLDQLHGLDRGEEVQAEDPLGVRRIGGEPGDGERVGARRQDGVGPHDAVEGPEDLVLRLVRLGHDLDHQVRVGGRVEVGEGTEAGQDVLPLLLGDPLAGHRAGGGGLQGGDGLGGGGVADVDADDLAAGADQDIGDTGAHGAEADDGDGGERGVHQGTPERKSDD